MTQMVRAAPFPSDARDLEGDEEEEDDVRRQGRKEVRREEDEREARAGGSG